MPVVVEVEQLVAPLGDDAQRILEEGHHDEEAANSREVSAESLVSNAVDSRETKQGVCSRLDRLANGVEQVLDLGGVGPELVEDAAVLVLGGSRATVGGRATKAVAGRRTSLHFENTWIKVPEG